VRNWFSARIGKAKPRAIALDDLEQYNLRVQTAFELTTVYLSIHGLLCVRDWIESKEFTL
jgi:hypothetical protein